MDRRSVLFGIGSIITRPLAASAQQQAVPVIGYLNASSPLPDTIKTPFSGFRRGLREAGFVEGKNIAIEYRWAEGHLDRLPAFARDLVARKVDVIVAASGDPPALAAKQATDTIPIVFTSVTDPVATGLVASLAHPGGNLTGFAFQVVSLGPKRLELLSEIVSGTRHFALLVNTGQPYAERQTRAAQDAAHDKGLQLDVLGAGSEAEIDAAFAALTQLRAGGLVVATDPFFTSRLEQLVAAAARRSVAAVYYLRRFAATGGLMSYGPDFPDLYRAAGLYVGRILNGEMPKNLPVQQPDKFELVINLKTAKALGLNLPQSLLARADEVIEMNRRMLLARMGGAAVFAAPLGATAQPARRVPQIALLLNGSPSDTDRRTAAFRQGLHDLGYVGGQSVAVLPHWADVPQRFSELAGDAVRNNVDVIVTEGTPAAQAAKRATGTIPIVMATSGDPVAVGLVASLARPGGNVTGQSILSPDLNGKRLELIKDLVPGISRVAVLLNPTNPVHAVDIKTAHAAAKVLGISLDVLEVRGPDDFEPAFQAATAQGDGALLALVDPFITRNRARVAQLAIGSRLPAVYGLGGFAEAGGLANYGPDLADMFRHAALFVDKILKGAKPADLPVEQPTKFEMVINLKTAKALGLVVPQSVLARADEAIE